MGLHTYGVIGVDWEERVRLDRLREERLARISSLLADSELAGLLCFDMANIRYITATHIGTWAQDKLNRFCLLPRAARPIMWDFGSAARHHQLYNPWLGEGRSRAGISTLRGAISPKAGRAEDVAEKIRAELEQCGLLPGPIGVDAVEPPILFALQAAGIDVVAPRLATPAYLDSIGSPGVAAALDTVEALLQEVESAYKRELR